MPFPLLGWAAIAGGAWVVKKFFTDPEFADKAMKFVKDVAETDQLMKMSDSAALRYLDTTVPSMTNTDYQKFRQGLSGIATYDSGSNKDRAMMLMLYADRIREKNNR